MVPLITVGTQGSLGICSLFRFAPLEVHGMVLSMLCVFHDCLNHAPSGIEVWMTHRRDQRR